MLEKQVDVGLETFKVYYTRENGKYDVKKVYDMFGYKLNMSVIETQQKIVSKIIYQLENEDKKYNLTA